MPKDWFLRQNGKTYGPLTSEKLKAHSVAGKVSANGEVANSKDGPWHPVTKIKGLTFASASPESKQNSATARRPTNPVPPSPPAMKASKPQPAQFAPPVPQPVQYAAPIQQPIQHSESVVQGSSQNTSKGESDIWSGCPSQITNLKTFILCGIFCWLLIPIFVAIWRFLLVKTTRYELTTQRFRSSYGVISKKTDELELYRVKDTAFSQTLFQRIFNLGTISITSSDSSTPYTAIQSIPASKAKELRETIRSLVEDLRDRKRVREVDYA